MAGYAAPSESPKRDAEAAGCRSVVFERRRSTFLWDSRAELRSLLSIKRATERLDVRLPDSVRD